MKDASVAGIVKLSLYVDPGNPPYAGILSRVMSLAAGAGMTLSASGASQEALAEFGLPESDECDAGMVLGGDGTILRGLKYFREIGVPVLGVNTGHLGFLASAEVESLDEILPLLASGDYRVENYPLLRAELPGGQLLTAMNDICINRSLLGGILHLELFLDRDPVAVMAGDGVVVSTPLGSTAYGLSCGGPILDPALPSMLVIAICPHQLSLRPLVVPDTMTVSIKIGELRGGSPFVSADGNPESTLNTGELLRITRDSRSCSVIHTMGRGSHYSHLGRKLGWGSRGEKGC